MAERIRIGTNPIAWSNDDMQELGAEISLDTCLSQAKAAGFEGIELGHKFPRTSEKLSQILDKHQIDLIGGWYSTELLRRSVVEEMRAAKDHMTLLSDMGCSVFIMAETSNAVHGEKSTALSESPVLVSNQWDEFGRRMSEFSTFLREQGFVPAYHHHMGTIVETENEIALFMEVTDEAVGLLLDTGHATFAGVDPAVLAQTYSSRITHVHCKDVRMLARAKALETHSSFLDAVVDGVFTVPGDGDVDFKSVLNVLSEGTYKGWLVVEAEQDPNIADPEKYANMGFENLRSLTTKAGMI